MEQTVAVLLMFRILKEIRESGANRDEALAALGAATAMLPELRLPIRPEMVIGDSGGFPAPTPEPQDEKNPPPYVLPDPESDWLPYP